MKLFKDMDFNVLGMLPEIVARFLNATVSLSFMLFGLSFADLVFV